MLPCIVMGDSIAQGVATYRPECLEVAKKGITSALYVRTLLIPHIAKTFVISLGVNDDASVATIDNLRAVRAQVHGQTVYWLLPGIKDRARAAINTVARQFGDFVIDTRRVAGPDHLHPTGAGYQQLAALTKIDTRPYYRPAAPTMRARPNHVTMTIWTGSHTKVYHSP